MKKIALLFVAAMCSMAMTATQYVGKLTVSINGVASSQDGVEVTVTTNADGTYHFALNNFVLEEDGDSYGVGNIDINNLVPVKAGGYTALAVTRNIEIEAGDVEGVDFWLGPMLGEVPIALTSILNDTDANVHIDIDMMDTALQQVIVVDFVTDGVATAPLRGDLNNSGIVDVDDVNEIINIILNK